MAEQPSGVPDDQARRREHMRTNRPYPEKGKDRGVILDYWGVFDRLQAAFAEFTPEEIEMAVLDLQSLKDSFLDARRRGARARRREAARRRVREDDVAAASLHERHERRRAVRGSIPGGAVRLRDARARPGAPPHVDDYRRP